MRFRRRAFGSAAALVLVACEVSDPNAARDRVVRASRVEDVSLSLLEVPLPPELKGDPTLLVATDEGSQTMIGGRAGLFSLSDGSLVPVDSAPVAALSLAKGVGIVVGGPSGIHVWNGALAESVLGERLGEVEVSALAARGDELWIATTADLFVLQGEELSRFDGFGSASRIRASESAQEVLVTHTSGSVDVLRELEVDWELRSLSAEIELSDALPGPSGRIFGLFGSELLERIHVQNEEVAWRPVSLSADENDSGAKGVQAAAIDPLVASVWVIDDRQISRIESTRVATIARPEGMGSVQSAVVGNDGALWVSDGDTLRRVGNDGPPVGYTETIQPFYEANCQRCHVSLGRAHSLEGYEVWVKEIGSIVKALDEARMPADGMPLVGGSIDLVKRWRDDGLRK